MSDKTLEIIFNFAFIFLFISFGVFMGSFCNYSEKKFVEKLCVEGNQKACEISFGVNK